MDEPMPEQNVTIERPQRWDHPLDPSMSEEAVSWLLTQTPFAEMDRRRFGSQAPLEDILRNDAKLHRLTPGDIVFQKGQYGSSAYLVMAGTIRVFLTDFLDISSDEAGRRSSRSPGTAWLQWFRAKTRFHDRRTRPRREIAEIRRDDARISMRGEGAETRLFLQDVPGVLDDHDTTAVGAGELFGELAAITRSPREFTAVSETESFVLEVRWQGLKLLKQSPEFRDLLDQRFRTGGLRLHLQETELFTHVPDHELDAIAEATRLESFGEMEWYADYRKHASKDPAERIAREPLIAEEGSYAAGLWIIRGGFARLSRRQGAGHRTLAYLGKGHIFGLRELVHNWRQPSSHATLPFQESLRAVGYVDALCIPKQVIIRHALPYFRKSELPPDIAHPRYRFGRPVTEAPADDSDFPLETGLLEFLVDQRLMNGRQTMVIDTLRCTRCDDCVRACASTHDDQPVFERRGAQYGPWLFPQACMHCEDPVCMIGCPTGAIHREATDGVVQIRAESCIGCKTCAESCPYDNIRMVESRDESGRKRIDKQSGLPILQASKCDLCTSDGGRPACQSACPHDALIRLDMSDLKGVARWLQSKGE
ncbi:MAG: cyclic nucleotide-binding domain-containing protein [Pirellulales bacterium]